MTYGNESDPSRLLIANIVYIRGPNWMCRPQTFKINHLLLCAHFLLFHWWTNSELTRLSKTNMILTLTSEVPAYQRLQHMVSLLKYCTIARVWLVGYSLPAPALGWHKEFCNPDHNQVHNSVHSPVHSPESRFYTYPLKATCIRQPMGQLPSSSYKHKTPS